MIHANAKPSLYESKTLLAAGTVATVFRGLCLDETLGSNVPMKVLAKQECYSAGPLTILVQVKPFFRSASRVQLRKAQHRCIKRSAKSSSATNRR